MAKYEHFVKTLGDLKRIGREVHRLYCSDHPTEVDIDLTVEKKYGLKIDAVPLRADIGVEAWCSISKRMLYVDLELADNPRFERRYRMTVAEELGHFLLHSKIYAGVSTYDQWATKWDDVPEHVHDQLDRDAKELAGIILMPEDRFTKAMIEARNHFCQQAGISGRPDPDRESYITALVIKKLMDDFNVNEEPCRIRINRITWKKGLFSI